MFSPRLALALKSGVSRELIAPHSGLLPGEATRVIDRLQSGKTVTFHQLVCVEAALDALTREAPLRG